MKKIISLILAVLMLASVSASAKTLEFTMGETTAYESAEKIESFKIENAPYTKNDRTMVPVRVISEKFGANVEWVEALNQVVITTSDKTITLTLGSKDAYINGELVALDAEPEEFNGRTMVPLRFIAEALGNAVEYVEPTEQILITDNEVIMTVDGKNIYYDDFLAALAITGYTPDQEYMLGDYVDFAMSAFIELYGSSAYLNSLGVYPPESYSSEVKSTIDMYRDSFEGVTLTAPVAKLLAADCFLTDYVYTYTETDEALDVALEMYEKDFATAKHILFLAETDADKKAAKKKADDTLKKIKAGQDFDKLMNELSEDPGLAQYPQGYTFTYGEMVPEFENAVFNLEVGKVSDVVETSYGYHIIKREPLTPADSSMASYLLELLANSVYQQVLDEANNNVTYVIEVPRETIIELLK